jgi:hypothetical protein
MTAPPSNNDLGTSLRTSIGGRSGIASNVGSLVPPGYFAQALLAFIHVDTGRTKLPSFHPGKS